MGRYTSPQLPNVEDVSSSDGSDLNNIDTATFDAFNTIVGGARIKGVYESTAQTITGTTNTSFTHGLGGKVTLACIHLICTSAEHGWSIGDKVIPSITHHGKLWSEFMIYIPGDGLTTKVNVVLGNYGAGGSVFSATEQVGNTVVLLDDSKWQWYLTVYLQGDSTADEYYALQEDATGTTDIDTYNNIATAAEAGFIAVAADIASGAFFTDQLTESYATSAIVIVAGASAANAHAMASVPTLMVVNITCISTDLGYAVGDVICLSHQPVYQSAGAAADDWGVTIESDATNITYWVGASGIAVAHNTTFDKQAIDPTKWTMIIKAWA